MAHFISSTHGSGGSTSRNGDKRSGIHSHTRGWNSGVKVDGWVITDDDGNEDDTFDIRSTGGSNGASQDERPIARIRGNTVTLYGPNGHPILSYEI